MKLGDPRVWLGAVTLLLVVTLFLRDLERTSPGPLTAAHAQDPALESSEGCALCHGSWRASMASACTDCHAEIETQLAEGAGFHGNLDADAQACERCHLEHHGREAELVAERSFGLAGFEGRAGYDHAGLAFELTGRHASLDCEQCHANADVATLASGAKRFLGLRQNCADCHEDPHGGRMRAGCAECHGQEQPFSEIAAFTHTVGFPLTGAHADRACLACHSADSPHAVEALAGRGAAPPARMCGDCHESPHSKTFVRGVSAFAGAAPDATCAVCHDAEHGSFTGETAVMSSDLHLAAGGFALDAPHDQAACADCHTGDHVIAFEADRQVRSPEACAACHDDPHGGQFDAGPFAGAGCLACHDPHAFSPPAFDAEHHARTAFPLTGSHRAVECSACHTVPDPVNAPTRVFSDTPATCASCHADVHRGAFEGAGLPETFRGEQGCARCHGTVHFAEGTRSEFDHAAWTRLALDGAHARAACEACHASTRDPAVAGRQLGFVSDRYEGALDRCETCHADVHAGTFDRPGRAPVVDGRDGCARCHTTGSFHLDDLREAFDHGTWTAFELDGAHLRADCQACHGPGGEPDSGSGGRALGFVSEHYPGSVESCATCHADVHAGAFAERDAAGVESTDCAACHTSEAFRDVDPQGFDHARWTGFALEGAHARTVCVACHVPAAPAQAAGRRLGAPAGSSCADCHADPHAGQFHVAGNSDCSACHAGGEPGFGVLAFDHRRDSRFPLDERHAKLECGACHVPWPVQGGREVVRYKPLGTTCRDCHTHGGDK